VVEPLTIAADDGMAHPAIVSQATSRRLTMPGTTSRFDMTVRVLP
jgi:hypothetical protein